MTNGIVFYMGGMVMAGGALFTEESEQQTEKDTTKEPENPSSVQLKKILVWCFFGCIFSFVPMLWSIIFNWLIDYDFSLEPHKIEYLIDFCLAVFAVATNACDAVILWNTDRRRQSDVVKGFLIGLSAFSMTVCAVAYAYFFNVPEKLRYDRISYIFYATLAIGIVNFFIGVYVAYKDS